MKKLLPYIAIFLTLACGKSAVKTSTQWKTIEIGNYLFDVPHDFKLKKKQGIDSYVGEIQGSDITIHFDNGPYSDPLVSTREEYLMKGSWRQELTNRLLEPGVVYDHTNMPKIEILEIRPATKSDSLIHPKSDYVAHWRYKSEEFDFAIILPKKIRNAHFLQDTIDNHYRKIVWYDEPRFLTGIHFKNLDSHVSFQSSLSLTTTNLTYEEQNLALTIF